MIPVSLARIVTRDRMALDGIVVEPRKKSRAALVWIHGLGSNFAHGQPLIAKLSAACRADGIGYFKFNTRGHDIVNRDSPRNGGSGFERFEDCIHDIRAVIREAKRLGYRTIILAGHSTGANKALYYLYKTKDPGVKGLVLLGAVSDIAAGRKKFGPANLARGVALAEKLVKKHPDALMPRQYGIFTAQRFLSMFRAKGAEDVFPYLDPRAAWKELKSIRAPVAVIFGDKDQYLNPPAQKRMDTFRANAPLAKSFSGAIIKDADHGFKGKEKEVALIMTRWIKQAVV